MSSSHDQPAKAAGPGADETAIVPPPTQPAPELAWSHEEPDEPLPRPWRLAWAIAGAGMFCAAVTAVLIAVFGMFGTSSEPAPIPNAGTIEPSTMPAESLPPIRSAPTVAPTRVAAPPTTVTVTPKPPPPTTVTVGPAAAPPSESVYDRRFLDRMRAAGWTITDPTRMTSVAHKVCREFQQGETGAQVDQELEAEGSLKPTDAATFSSNATESYPNC
jgi:hypothetical protein